MTPNLNNDNFEATISFGKNSGTLYVEITYAKAGYDESRRIEVLTRAGSVNLTGPIVKTQGRRGTPDRVVEVRNKAIRHDLLLAKHLSLAEAAVRAKANRAYGPRHVLLLVSPERYFDTVTRRMVAVGRHGHRLVIVPYDQERDIVTPVTIHAITRP